MGMIVVLELSDADNEYQFDSHIAAATEKAQLELTRLDDIIGASRMLRPECDRLDYALAVSSGVLCSLFDIFLVGAPNDSELQSQTDQWFSSRIQNFARFFGWDGEKGDLASAIKKLEDTFGIPYDQTGQGISGTIVFSLSPMNHHFKSLGHNPTLFGLFFSILDQFTNQSHFVSGGQMIALTEASGSFELRGATVPARLFCGFTNWLGHLFSDMTGSSGSARKGNRGMGIPSPLWTWANDAIATLQTMRIRIPDWLTQFNEFAMNLYLQGYDLRFQAMQAIPVMLNELITRLLYLTRRLVEYYREHAHESLSPQAMWTACEPFTNPSVKRMLTVAHGTFCLFDATDAIIRGATKTPGSFDVQEIAMRLNIVGIGRFAISLYGEGRRAGQLHKVEQQARFASRERIIVEDYLAGLVELGRLYDDRQLIDFTDAFKNSGPYIRAFEKSARLAALRRVPKDQILTTKSDIDSYFNK
ncbi:hypothetical protein BAAM1489_06120 [Bifidobacterium animalis subsp. animalis MCC 1489]|uniref:Uncharacterized protein n=1 Tax=Bifidobacterium animalis subsp. animalis IM386 TaxID=1402194 RepID=A0AAV2W1A7_9BIFI|nr:hypothetical protein [Bifidobacterium animalis]AFI63726.1 hypothetical protein BANAN_07635 [Bifidobacterium animalis subsp. animalis ATCC 25527]AYN24345.1 hypothetical protein CNCMI4602_1516 [Bifidobacterium animalis subsp. animalis]KFI42083.1 hypothetical protein BASA_1363 [Bifidobacterium animalis subsp. animalis]KOA63475.1 hypothetical protein BAAM1489_06120 [Bifidobacterium animalis subsp. animalis MCC 1489]CDI67012.1 Uncharacterized protein BANIM336_00321 [Bifidobacterium animalis subs